MPPNTPRRAQRAHALLAPRFPLAARCPLAALAGLAMLVTFAGCAPFHARPAPGASPGSESASPPDSASTPAAPSGEELEPPASEASPSPATPELQVLVVRASAYNSRHGQTDSTPSIGAWGDRLRPGMRVIAVSRDLLERGLVRGQRVRIRGLEGEYVVLDRMPSRWRQKIDIYMGNDVRAARQWGVREVEIEWLPAIETVAESEAQ